ncbi:VOC family protein [Achromobacter insuavis]|uniref:VOC family protein n=1 Tax=Achromobacter insuavis TaxID=1287735 RepID=UPI001F137B7D|nr:VOC family protein [Achromobacter insuavis]
MSSISSIGSVQLSFAARQLDAVREFYRGTLGLDEMPVPDGRLLFALGDATLSLSPVAEVSRGVRADYLAIRTGAYDDILLRLRDAGYHPVCSLPDASPRVMYVKDPSGNQLAFLG